MAPELLRCRTAGEWQLHSSKVHPSPFLDVAVDVTFTSPSGREQTIPAFYDGQNTWRFRFSPNEQGTWHYCSVSCPSDPGLDETGAFEAIPGAGRGFLRSTPGEAWGFCYESGEPAFIWGDTTYNLFGMAYCGANVTPFLKRRAEQGFNLLRVRLPVSYFHPPDGYNLWQTRRTWPWGGSEQAPRFDRFNLEYFHTVDAVVRQAEQLGIGLEMIMEGWGFEFPFNSRQIFTPEWEELWMRYLIARYDAFSCVYFWTLLNEYEYYPNGDWHYKPVADRWAMRVGRWVRGLAQHGHIIAVHNGPREPAFARRFADDPAAIDTIMYQEWGTRDRENGWLAIGIEDQTQRSLEGWWGSAVFAEYGYERNPDFALNMPSHEFCDPEHTRRSTWRGLCCGLGVVHGFENTWGPWQKLDEDQPGMVYLAHARRFFTDVAPFAGLRPCTDVVAPAAWAPGRRPLALASADRSVIVVYFPAGGEAGIMGATGYRARWFNPRTGELAPAAPQPATNRFSAPHDIGGDGRPLDWVLLLQSGGVNAS